jgi:hypothetical protein
MKQLFAGAALLVLTSFPASASSIEFVDEIVTGAKGSKSIITLGEASPCAETACVDASGGDPKLNTASAQQQAALAAKPPRKINFEFARKFPDPANPVPLSAPAKTASGAPNILEVPKAPADSGRIAAQPPVAQPPQVSTRESDGRPLQTSRGTIDPNAPKMPIASTELREGE